jgi:hypothetical protein
LCLADNMWRRGQSHLYESHFTTTKFGHSAFCGVTSRPEAVHCLGLILKAWEYV